MVSDCGIAEDRLEAIGVGESFLLDETDPRGDENRRVEFQALS
jgi:OOP family OmpA-OmpF porin